MFSFFRFFRFFAVFLFLFSTTVSADVIVDAEGKSQKYPDGSTLNIVAAKNIHIEYYGIKCFIPKGERISLRCSDKDEEHAVYFSGKEFKNIKLGDVTLTTDKVTVFVVSQDGVLRVETGTIVIRDKKGNIAILEQGNTYKVSTNIISSDSFVPVNKNSQQQYEQVQQDIILSPSAPRN